MVLSVSAGWEADARDPSALRAPARRTLRGLPVGAPIEASLGRAGLAWGRGLLPDTAPGAREARGRRQVARWRLRPAPRDGLREGGALRHADAVPARRPRRCAAWTTPAPSATTGSPTRRRRRRTGPRPRTCVGRTTSTASWSGWATTTRPVVPGGGSCIFLHLRSGPDATTSGCTAFDPEPMERLLRWLDPAARPVLVQLPDAEYHARAAAWGLPEPGRTAPQGSAAER